MKVEKLSHHQINKSAWDECINHSPNGLVYALSWYLDTVSPDWEAIIVTQNTTYQVCFPLPVRQRWGISYLYHPYFCQQLGIYHRQPLSKELIEKIFQTLFTHYSYIPRLFLNVSNIWSIPRRSNLRLRRHFTHLLELNQPYADLRKQYRRDRRYRLKQACAKKLRIVSSDDIGPLVDIFLRDTVQKVPGAQTDPTYSQVRRLFNAVKRNGRYELYYTQDDYGNYTSGAWFVIYNYRIIYLFNAALDTARRENGRTLIIDHVIRKYQNSPYIVDFESPEKETIRDFYASFGSIPTPFYFLYFYNLPTVVRRLHRTKILVHRQLLKRIYPSSSLPDIIIP